MKTKQALDVLLQYVVVHCKTEEEANKVLELAEKIGYRWKYDSDSFKKKTNYNSFKEKTCYSFVEGMFCDIKYYKERNYRVITAQEFIDLVNGEDMEQEVVKEQQISVKNDRKDGKLRWELLPLSTIKEIVKVYTFGANKYGANRWQNLDNGYERYKAALFRHMVAFEEGEITDKESGLHHLAHMAWNAIAMLYFAIKEGRK